MITFTFALVCYWLMLKIWLSARKPQIMVDYDTMLAERKMAFRRAGKRLVM